MAHGVRKKLPVCTRYHTFGIRLRVQVNVSSKLGCDTMRGRDDARGFQGN